MTTTTNEGVLPTTIAAELADAIERARTSAAALVSARHDGADEERIDLLARVHREAERIVGLLTS